MAGILRVPRSRGALSGVLLILLGVWGALIPLVGPYFHYAYPPDTAWSFTSGRIWLEIAPGAAAFIGGLIVLVSSLRPVAMFGAWLAASEWTESRGAVRRRSRRRPGCPVMDYRTWKAFDKGSPDSIGNPATGL